MNVLIDTLPIRRQKAGVGVYAHNLVRHLVGLDNRVETGFRLFILAQNDDSDFDYSAHPQVSMIWASSRLFRSFPLRFFYEQFVLPWLLLIHKIDVVHSLHYSFPFIRFGTRQVVTLHDMTFFTMPQNHVPLKVGYFRTFIRAALAMADAIIFVSNSAQRDCLSILGNPRGSHIVIHHGKGETFSPNFDIDRLDQVRATYAIPENYILYIGTIEPRKNLSTLVAAFADIADHHPQLHLVLAGMKGWSHEFEHVTSLVSSLNITRQVIFTGFVEERDKPLLLAGAAVFAYPSLYEGFGLPVLEALACGVPTVTSNISSLPEVAGTAAILVNPTSQHEWAIALDLLITNPLKMQELRAQSVLQASRFSWRKAAITTLSVYAALADQAQSASAKSSPRERRKLKSLTH